VFCDPASHAYACTGRVVSTDRDIPSRIETRIFDIIHEILRIVFLYQTEENQ
jgi:hypothetical protein